MRLLPPERLATLVRDCQRSGVARQVLLVRADRLPDGLSRPHHLRLAEAALAPLMEASRALLFHMPGPRYAITWRGEAEEALAEVLRALAHLLADAPPGTPVLGDLAFLYELPQQGDSLLRTLEEEAGGAAGPIDREAAPPLDAEALATLEANLAQADVARFARRRAVWRIAGGAPTLAWEQRTLSVTELAAGLMPGRDVRADPWLFRRLTRTLDRRMLALLASPGELAAARPFALDLNVASVLSPEFLRFDAALPAALRGQVTIGLAAADILADAASFVFARGFARARGYRLMLRGVGPELLRMVSAAALEMDSLQFHWAPGLAETAPEGIAALAPGRLVLGRADEPPALAWGARAGIRLFQGIAADEAALGERSHAA